MMHSLYLRGEDVGTKTYWAWEWADGLTPPEFVVLDREVVDPALAALDDALPGLTAAEVEAPDIEDAERVSELDGPFADPNIRGTANAKDVLMADRCMKGALVDRVRERELFTALGRVLLPESFLASIRERGAAHGVKNVEVRVLSAPSCVRVPWELLVTGNPYDADERLLDLASVVTMGPLLGRDGNPDIPHPNWHEVRSAPPLYIIDPRLPNAHGGVLTAGEDEPWYERIGEAEHTYRLDESDLARVHAVVGREALSDLLNEHKRSRFVYVGHVTANEGTAGKTALQLADHREVYGLGRYDARTRNRPLTAQDLVAGTFGFDAHIRNLSNTRDLTQADVKRDEFGGDTIVFPKRAVVDGVMRPVLGSVLWPMPPRVALIACHSGADFAHAEPFGLVTAILDGGAEMVAATRWVLLTDLVFQLFDASESTPLNSMALKMDEVLGEEDPLAALARWQREKLAAWREHGRLSDSPLSWGSISITHAPDRTDRDDAGVNDMAATMA